MRKTFTAALVSLAVLVPGVAAAAPAVAANPQLTTVAADSWVDAPGGAGTYAPGWVNNKKIDVLDGTKYRMYCWWSEPIRGKMFYGKFTSGSHKDDLGDMRSVHIRGQISVPPCDD